ncbi:MAG: hypothetical protein A3K19_16570 [Lentisphaerae bacterium RIFOXYB12_FULL_65_16]|nr:MAG: hypothetical protein A3K18_24680 [Lentisphaerae bacterium RIFOXYA12_64_32]OGV89057.1 MAG: hypothetical protein A3K19_16570 [Lentisphaerae bacterium RIFOXYB12_FULL_65_16]
MSTANSVAPQGGCVYDLNVGESVEFRGRNGTVRRITLVALHEQPDRVRGVVRFPRVTVDVDGERADLVSALYRLPSVVNGVKIGCAVTRQVAKAVSYSGDIHALDKDARLRCWAPDAPYFGPRPMVYPARQAWFASMTQMGNERTYVDAGELTLNDPKRGIYYHYGVDIGGYDKAVPIVAAAARTPPTMHVTYYPTQDLRPNQPIAFKARAFIRGAFAANKGGIEHWDFGDGCQATSCSDDQFDERWHAYAKPGRYIVTVERKAKNGVSVTAQLKVVV